MSMPAARNPEPRPDSTVPPIGGEVDLYALTFTALLTRLTHQLGQELAAEYATHDITAQPLDASLFILVAGGDARLTELAAQLNKPSWPSSTASSATAASSASPAQKTGAPNESTSPPLSRASEPATGPGCVPRSPTSQGLMILDASRSLVLSTCTAFVTGE
jgi:hypothetical protein